MPAYNDFTVDANTKALWHMDGSVGTAAKKDNAETTAALDITEQNVPGSGAGFNGETDGAYTLDGVNDYLQVADADALDYNGSQNKTVEFWFKLGDTTGVQTIISKWQNGGGSQEWILYANGTTLTFALLGGTVATATIAADTLYYVALTMNSSKYGELYLNAGTPTHGTGPNSVEDLSSVLRFGENAGQNRAYLTLLDECRVSDKVRTSTEIGDYYNGSSSGPANVKTINGLAKASVKTVNGLAIASVKSINGLA